MKTAKEYSEQLKQLLKEFDKLTALVAVILVVLLTAGYFLIEWIWPQSPMSGFATGLIIEFIPVFVAFLVAYFLLRRVQSIRESQHAGEVASAVLGEIEPKLDGLREVVAYERFNDVPWGEWIRNAKQIDINVHYFDTWLNQHPDAFRDFFSKTGAQCRIILPDVNDDGLLSAIASRFPDMKQNELVRKIRNTSTRLGNFRRDAKASEPALIVCQVKTIQWYCAVRFDNQRTVFSIYENARKGGTEAPAFVIDHSRHPRLSDWTDREFKGLISQAEEIDVDA